MIYLPFMGDVTQILSQIEQGDQRAADELLPLVYDELRKLATQRMAHERPGQTLDATGLVHEAYLRLVERTRQDCWDSRGHFFGAAAEAMRRILVDRARAKQTTKRGGERKRQPLGDVAAAKPDEEVLALDAALTRLMDEDPQAAKVVELRYFARLNHDDTARALGITVYRARQKWTYARAWLRDAVANQE